MKTVSVKLALLSMILIQATSAIAGEIGETCDMNAPNKGHVVKEYYVDNDGRCRAIVLYCVDGILEQLELPSPPAAPEMCGLENN